MGSQFGHARKVWKRGDALNEPNLNQNNKAAITRIRGGPGIKARAGINEVVLSVDKASKTPYIGRLVVHVTGDLGGGYYSWAKDFGEGPDLGQAAGTGVADTRALEITGKTGITSGTKVLIFRIAGVWYFKDGGASGSGFFWSSYPNRSTPSWDYWGQITNVVSTQIIPQGAGDVAGASFSNRFATALPYGIQVPVPKQFFPFYTFYFASIASLPASFNAIGPRGIRIRWRVSTLRTGDTITITLAVGDPTLGFGSMHPTARVVRFWTSATADTTFVDMVIPQNLLVGVFQPGDPVYLTCTFQQTGTSTNQFNTTMLVTFSGIELDGTG